MQISYKNQRQKNYTKYKYRIVQNILLFFLLNQEKNAVVAIATSEYFRRRVSEKETKHRINLYLYLVL